MSLVGGTGGFAFGRSGAEKYSEPGVSGPECGGPSRSGGEPVGDVTSVTGPMTCSSVLDLDFVGDAADMSWVGEVVDDNGVVLVFCVLVLNGLSLVTLLYSRTEKTNRLQAAIFSM